jgi:basic membrane protein A
LAADGYDVIVTVGTSIAHETAQAASRYSKLYFIGVDQPQEKKLRNLTGLVFHEEYGGFMAGVLAARMTQTGQIAAVCEANFVDPVRRYCEGFRQGALYAKPGVDVTVEYYDGSSGELFNNTEWGRSVALQQVNHGADVVFAAGGATGDAALEGAASEGAYVIGSETDLYSALPDIRPHLLTSATNDVRTNLVELLTLTRRGKFPAGEYMGTESLAPWHDFERQVPTAVKQEMDQIHTRLALGVIPLDIPYTQP